MQVKVLDEETDDTIYIDLDDFELSPPEEIVDEDDNFEELDEHIRKVIGADPQVMYKMVQKIRDYLSLGEEEEWPDDKLYLYFGNLEEHRTYYRIIVQRLQAIMNDEAFQFNRDEVDTEISTGTETTDLVQDDADRVEDTDSQAEEEEPEMDDHDETHNDEDEELIAPIKVPEGLPMPQITSNDIEQIEARRVSRARSEVAKPPSAAVAIKSNFKPPERPVAFARTEPSRPRAGLEVRTVNYNGIPITFFTNKKQEEK